MKNSLKKGVIVVLVCMCSTAIAAHGKKVTLRADHTHYQENRQQMVASSNVVLTYGDVEIQADKLHFDTIAKVVWGTGKVTVTRGEDTFDSTYFFFDLDKNIVKINDIHIAVRPPDSKANIFLRAKRIEDHPSFKIGKRGLFTTCELEQPHYYIWAQKFKYIPEKKVVGYNVILYNPFFLVPFPLPFVTLHYSPYYTYDVGKRKHIWNFPTIGKKTTPGWGWFVQNTFDYNNIDGRDSSIFVDWFENKGIGSGIRHQYTMGDHYGSVYYYQLRERDTKIKNERKEWDQTFNLSDPLSLNLRYKEVDAERINVRGRQELIERSVKLDYDDLGNKYNVSFQDQSNARSRLNAQNIKIGHSVNGEKRYNIAYNESDRTQSKLRRRNADIIHYKNLPYDMKIKNTFKYGFEDDYSQGDPADETLKYYFLFDKKITDRLSFDLNMSHRFDLDDDAFLADDTSNRNDFLFKHPEVNLTYKRNIAGFDLRETMTMGRYQEVKYDGSTNLQRIFPEVEEGLAPNAYIFKQSLSRNFSKLPQQGRLNTTLSYDQYVFDTEGKNITEGDALYSMSFKSDYSMTHLGFIQTKTGYESQYAPKENNSPFHTFNRNVTNRNNLDEKITLYYKSPSKYSWGHQSGYNFILDQWRDYQTDVRIAPNKGFRFTAKTGKRLNYSDAQRASRFLPLSMRLEAAPTSSFRIDYRLNLDVNKWRDEDIQHVNQSSLKLIFRLGHRKDYAWNVNTTFTYNTIDQPDTIEATRYEMQEIGIEKREHRRTVTLSYRKATDEFRFKFTIDAYPKDSFGFKKTDDIWKVEGVLDDKSEERF